MRRCVPSHNRGEPAEAAWLAQLLANLEETGAEGRAAVAYLRARGIAVGFHDQSTGARWKLGGRLELHPRFAGGPADAPYALALIVHEVRHLRQGVLTALSVYGELDAWQVQFRFIKSLMGRYSEVRQQDQLVAQLMSLPVNWDRRILEEARSLMQQYAGKGYRIDLLPLYPLNREILWRLGHKVPPISPGRSQGGLRF
jgi:hypothetical protein